MNDERVPKKKRCAWCGRELPLYKFGDNLRMRRGKKSYCRLCEKLRKRLWIRDNRLLG